MAVDYVYLPALLSAPVILFMVGIWMYKFPPKKVNYYMGYRTPRSKRSPEAWREANRYSSKLLVEFSLILIAVTLWLWFLKDPTDEYAAQMAFIDTFLLLLFMVLLIIMTERHLKKMFEN
ncbi:SdpI family protein [Methanolapillus millepedarum]